MRVITSYSIHYTKLYENGLTIVSDMDSSYQTVLTNSNGCDSLLTLNVKVVPPVVIVEDPTLCMGEPEFAWNSSTVVGDRDSVYRITSYNVCYTKLLRMPLLNMRDGPRGRAPATRFAMVNGLVTLIQKSSVSLRNNFV